ncbi:unnamed protein product [Protopolystoma xenopodis]|uniref:Uncharacterized protein n=1 Tax=Protopolystoma xenopodis TaxID=117903 RepID=A0A3S5CQL8_9PLAT|nr:unnamed protein product [Protopolystoma xenopodis]
MSVKQHDEKEYEEEYRCEPFVQGAQSHLTSFVAPACTITCCRPRVARPNRLHIGQPEMSLLLQGPLSWSSGSVAL